MDQLHDQNDRTVQTLTWASVSYTIVLNIPRRLTQGATEEEFRIKYFQIYFRDS